MAGDPGSERAASYRFWAECTATQARDSGRPRQAVDRRVLSFFRAMCRTVEPTVCLELGAHEARFSRWSKRHFPDARCVALEANPYVYEKFRDRLAATGVEYHHLAATATNGTVTLHVPTVTFGKPRTRANRMASLGVHEQASGVEQVEVASVRVDDFLQLDDDDRLVAWIDVEGASEQVLTGGREVLARASAVYIEVESTEQWPDQWLDVDVADFLHAIGKLPAARDVQRDQQYNVVFLDADLAARPEIAQRAARVLVPPRRRSPLPA